MSSYCSGKSLALPCIIVASHLQRKRLSKKQNTFIKETEKIVKNLYEKLSLKHGTIPEFITLLVNLLNTTNLQPDVDFKTSKILSDYKSPTQN